MTLTTLQVGELYCAERREWTERYEYNYRCGMHEIRFFAQDITTSDVRAFQIGTMELGLYSQAAPLVFLAFRIKGFCDWSDSSFSIHRVPESERGPAPNTAVLHMPLTAILINADTGIIEAFRVGTLAPPFSARLHDMINQQITSGYREELEDSLCHETLTKHPTSSSLASACSITCTLGR